MNRWHETAEVVERRLREELAGQLGTLRAVHDEQVAAERAQAEMAAEEKWSALLDRVRAETSGQVEAAVAAARAEFERDQKQTGPAEAWVLESFQALESATSLTATLEAILRIAVKSLPGSRLFIATGPDAREWKEGIPEDAPSAPEWQALAADVARSKTTIEREGALGVPLLLDGRAVAVLCAAPAGAASHSRAAAEIVARAGATRLAFLTASRTLRARQWLSLA